MAADLLGCICIFNAEKDCERNCCVYEHDCLEEPPTVVLWVDRLQFQDPKLAALERVKLEEDNRSTDIVALEAWSDGRLAIWFSE